MSDCSDVILLLLNIIWIVLAFVSEKISILIIINIIAVLALVAALVSNGGLKNGNKRY